MTINTVMYSRHETWNATRNRASTNCIDTGQSVSPGVAKRLYKFAMSRLSDAGFNLAVEGWPVLVYTTRAEEKPSERTYCVRWKNSEGGYIEVVGIAMTRNGHPESDIGLAIGQKWEGS